MTLDITITNAVQDAVKSSGENNKLARKILSMIEDIHSGAMSLEDKDDVKRRIEVLLEGLDDGN